MTKWIVRLLAVWVVLLAAGAVGQQTKIVYGPSKWASPVKPAAMYAQYCAVCHGADMKGNGAAAAALHSRPADLTRLARTHGGEFPYHKVLEVVRGDEVLAANHTREMPLWGHQLWNVYGDDKVVLIGMNNLVEYIRTRQEK